MNEDANMMENSNEIRPPHTLGTEDGIGVRDPHTLYNKNLTNHLEYHRKRRLEDYKKYLDRIYSIQLYK